MLTRHGHLTDNITDFSSFIFFGDKSEDGKILYLFARHCVVPGDTRLTDQRSKKGMD